MPRLLDLAEKNAIIAELGARFGLPEAIFQGYLFFEQGKRSIWIIRENPYLKEILTFRRLETIGLRILRWVQNGWKPTTYGLQLFGASATRNVVTLTDIQVRELFQTGKVEGVFPVEKGYVIIRSWVGVLGCGFYADTLLLSQIPLHRSRMVTAF